MTRRQTYFVAGVAFQCHKHQSDVPHLEEIAASGKNLLISPWWTLKYLFNMPVTPGKVLLGEGMLLLACCGYIRKVNFIFRNSKKNGMECQGLCFPCGKHNPIVHFYGKRSIKKGMEFLQYSGAHRIIHRKTAFQMPPKCRDQSRGYALLLTARKLPQTAL